MITQSKIFRTLVRQVNIVRPSHNNIFKNQSSKGSKLSVSITGGWVAPHMLLDNVLNDRGRYQQLIKQLYFAGLEDPFEERQEISSYVKDLFQRYNPKTELDKGILLFRAVITPSTGFFSPSGIAFHGLTEEEGGLCIQSDDDPNAPLRAGTGNILPKKLITAPQENRVALCLEYSQLLVAMLRSAGIRAHIKGEPEHAVVIAVMDGSTYKLDATNSLIEASLDGGRSDRESISCHYSNKGGMFGEQGKFKEAIDACDIALEIDPRNINAWNNKGDALRAQGKHEEAIEAFDKALGIDPRKSFVWNNKGLALSEQGKLEEAIKSYNKALELDPHNLSAWNNKGDALYEQGHIVEAIEEYDKLLEINLNYAIRNKRNDILKKLKNEPDRAL